MPLVWLWLDSPIKVRTLGVLVFTKFSDALLEVLIHLLYGWGRKIVSVRPVPEDERWSFIRVGMPRLLEWSVRKVDSAFSDCA